MKRFVVIVDQSTRRQPMNFSAFGPYSLMTAESVMVDIHNAASEGEFDVNRIVLAQIHEGSYNTDVMIELLKEKVT